MKKILVVLMIFAMAVPVAACGNERGNNTPDQNRPSASSESTSDSVTDDGNLQGDSDAELTSGNADTQDGINPEENDGAVRSGQGSNILIAYFSRVGNTEWEAGVDAVTSASINVEGEEFVGNAEYLAKMAQEVTGGDLFLIQTETTYPSDYRETTDVAAEEQDDDARPALASYVENMDQYDVIVLVYPNWWGTLPQPVFTFLEEYDFAGKTILPLCTHEGSRMGSSERAIAELCPDAILLSGLDVRGSRASSAESDVEAWIENSGIIK